MFKVPKIAASGIAGMLIVASVCLTGCGSEVSSPSSSSKQSSTPSGQQASTQQQPASSVQQPPARGNNQNMETMLAKAAEILGISTDKLASAFEEAQASLKPEGQQPTGQPPQDGQQPPSGQQPAGQPPQDGQKPQGGPDMQALYDKMAETLGISADTIASAFEQAAKALQK